METDSQSYDPHEALSVKEIAKLLHISEPTIRGWVKSGQLPSLELGGSRRILRRDLDTYIAIHRKYGLRPLGKPERPTFADGYSDSVGPCSDEGGEDIPF
jgi:excisionase family DNA binding protein